MLRYSNTSFAEAYRFLLQDCLSLGAKVSPRGKTTKELDDVFITIPGNAYPSALEGRTNVKYMANELAWYLSGTSDPTRVASHAKMWDNCRNPDGTVNSNYGVAIFDDHRTDFDPNSVDRSGGMNSEWMWCLDALRRDPDTRQAMMVIHRPQHHWFGNKDLPCTMNIRFRIQHGALVTRALMRSCDLWWGLPYDAAWFQVVHRGMWDALNHAGIKMRLGSVHIQLDSAHLYERHWPKARSLTLQQIRAKPITQNTQLSKVLVDMEALAASTDEELMLE